MLNQTDTLSRFLQPVVGSPQILTLQKLLIKAGSPSGNAYLAAARCLSLLFDLDLSALLMTSVTKIDVSDPSEETLEGMSTVQALAGVIAQYQSTLVLGISEAKAFLPAPTIDILTEYVDSGSPTYRVGIATFLVLTANLQDL